MRPAVYGRASIVITLTPDLSFANNRSGYKLLCSKAFITVVESAELWKCNNLSVAQRLSRERTLFAEAQMGSRIMVVAEITRQRSFEVARIQNDVVVQPLPSMEPISRSAYGFCHGL